MKILSFLFPGFTALDLIGPTTAWGLMPGAEFQTVARTPGPVKVDMGLEIVATHSFDNCWSALRDPHEILAPSTIVMIQGCYGVGCFARRCIIRLL